MEPVSAQLVLVRPSGPEQQIPRPVPWRPVAEFQVSGVRDSVLPTDSEPGEPALAHSAPETRFQRLFVEPGESTRSR